MKRKMNAHALILLLLMVALLTLFSCRKDDCDCSEIEEPVTEENPDNPDGIGMYQNYLPPTYYLES